MGRKRINVDPTYPLPKGLYRQGRQYRTRKPEGPWVYFKGPYSQALFEYAAWQSALSWSPVTECRVARELMRAIRKNASARGIAVEIDAAIV